MKWQYHQKMEINWTLLIKLLISDFIRLFENFGNCESIVYPKILNRSISWRNSPTGRRKVFNEYYRKSRRPHMGVKGAWKGAR